MSNTQSTIPYDYDKVLAWLASKGLTPSPHVGPASDGYFYLIARVKDGHWLTLSPNKIDGGCSIWTTPDDEVKAMAEEARMACRKWNPDHMRNIGMALHALGAAGLVLEK